MAKDDKYNGWANYATWRINLEIFDGMEEVPETGDGCEEYVEEVLELDSLSDKGGSMGLVADCARAFLSEVDWDEIAENHTEEAEED